jgi:hypothetical protein
MFDFLLVGMSLILGIAGIVVGIVKRFVSRKVNRIIIQSEDERINIPANISKEDLEKLREKLKEIEIGEIELKKDVSKNSGLIKIDFLILVVPGIIALLFAGTFIYLIVSHQDTPNYTTPKELGAAMTTIIGYYFGIGASAAVNKGKTLSLEEIKKLIGESK